MRQLTVILFLSILTFTSFGQEAVEAGKMYKGGENIFDPETGTTLTIPPHWRGYATMQTDMLTLNSDTSNASLRIFAVEDNLVSIKNQLNTGIEIGPGSYIKPKGEITFDDNILVAELYLTDDPKTSGYYMVKCGQYGNCIGYLFGAETRNYKDYYEAVYSNFQAITLGQPTQGAAGENYNWAAELSGKYLFHYESNNTGIRGNQIWLCSDGSFTANLKRKGIFKEGDDRRIRGNHFGKYKLEGIGKEGVIVLNFDKVEEEIVLKTEFRDGDIYINNIKYFVASNTKCQ